MRITPENITELKVDELFVYGDNEKHVHGAGAALQALKFGARHGAGNRIVGQTWGIPTKDEKLKVLSLEEIREYVNLCLGMASTNFGKKFKWMITKIGTGLSGFKNEEIAPMFEKALTMENVYLPLEFINIIKQTL